ncbi:MAG: Mur ligase family protein [Bacillota bacterium]|jgi:UDP-N-acetylmuramoylalanine--D-glutamate ligase
MPRETRDSESSRGSLGTLGRFCGREVAIVGMGKSNQALCRYLAREGAVITCFDRKTAEELGDVYTELSRLGVKWSLGPDYLSGLPSFKWIFLTPGMKKSLPEIVAAKENGAIVSGEIALFLERCKAKVCGITGSAGKTTTSTLTGMMLKESLPGVPVYVGGNIGSVLIEEVDDIPPEVLVVLELSSFQLELCNRSPEISVILNLRPNHLDVHDSFQDYVQAKKRIYQFQNREDWCILNQDDPITGAMVGECPGNTARFSTDEKGHSAQGNRDVGTPSARAWLDGNDLKVEIQGAEHYRSDSHVDGHSDIRSDGSSGSPSGSLSGSRSDSRSDSRRGSPNEIHSGRHNDSDSHTPARTNGPVTVASRDDFLVPGDHNISNALAASLAALLMGGNPQGIRRAIRSFRGVEHRIELVRKVNGVTYYNDSIATSPDRTEAFLHAVPGPLVLILGGYDKGIPFDGLAQKIVARENVAVVTLGKTAPLIEAAIDRAVDAANRRTSQGTRRSSETAGRGRRKPDVTRAGSLEEAVRIASAKARPGWSVGLSPACASYDMFRSFEERGQMFKDIVAKIPDPSAIYEALAPHYPGVKSRLLETSKGNPVDTLVATILSQATNDNVSTKAFANLKQTFSDWDSLLEADAATVEKALKPGGLYREKTAALKAALNQIKKDFGEVTLEPLRQMTVHEAFRYLTSLRGVGPKTAACVLAFGLGKPAFPVDTHVLRIARRLGLVPQKAQASKAQEILETITPDDLKMPLHLTLIEHGRKVCSSSRPKCGICPLRGCCSE